VRAAQACGKRRRRLSVAAIIGAKRRASSPASIPASVGAALSARATHVLNHKRHPCPDCALRPCTLRPQVSSLKSQASSWPHSLPRFPSIIEAPLRT
jgi:hypothetical protein